MYETYDSMEGAADDSVDNDCLVQDPPAPIEHWSLDDFEDLLPLQAGLS